MAMDTVMNWMHAAICQHVTMTMRPTIPVLYLMLAVTVVVVVSIRTVTEYAIQKRSLDVLMLRDATTAPTIQKRMVLVISAAVLKSLQTMMDTA